MIILDLLYHVSECDVFRATFANFPTIPECDLDILSQLCLCHIAWFSGLHVRDSKVQEDIAMVRFLASAEQFNEL